MVSKEHQEDAVCNGNLRELAHGSDWLMIVQDRLDVAGKKETKAGYVSGQRYGQIHKAVWNPLWANCKLSKRTQSQPVEVDSSRPHTACALKISHGIRARFVRTWFQLPLKHKLTPMPFQAKKKLHGPAGCSTSSRRRCAHPWCPGAVLGRSTLSHVRPEERRPLEACPSLSYSLSKKNLSRRKLSTWVLWWRLKHGERRCFWHGGFKEKGQAKKEMLVLKLTAQICPFMMRVALEVQGTSTGSLFVHMMCSLFIINLSKRGRLYPLGMVAGVYVDTQGEWSSPKSRGDWYTSSDTSNSPTTKNVKTKVFCHCISSLGHVSPHSTGSVVKCSMGHYAIRRVTCEALYGDSNTLVPGIRKRAAHKTETITTVC
ncbi:hypothetical protein IGI04_036682 [Brassica rapa subsp. trilocularis]|uniref:Uncharacterized protein n=1 Tax=Brassica rapa subsp. trilocularis TaxID=1813537 RepID=A0ABQ7LG51_BRACM|nr:hypothetical protein IGI04_036682 [Brassica rapa subsp. trilocularis]